MRCKLINVKDINYNSDNCATKSSIESMPSIWANLPNGLDGRCYDVEVCTEADLVTDSAGMSISKCLWELKSMRSGVKADMRVSDLSEEDKAIDLEQIAALNTAIGIISNKTDEGFLNDILHKLINTYGVNKIQDILDLYKKN